MRKAYAAVAPCQLPNAARYCGANRKVNALNARISRAAREVWTAKTALNLAAVTGYSPRACEYWLSGAVAIPGDAIADLIRCEFGQRFLAAVIGDATPRWWLQFANVFALFTSAGRRQSAQAELEAAIHADELLRATIARSETAALLPASNVAGASDHASRRAPRARDRAVARQGSRR